jgi:hypothetical protein
MKKRHAQKQGGRIRGVETLYKVFKWHMWLTPIEIHKTKQSLVSRTALSKEKKFYLTGDESAEKNALSVRL